MSEYMLMQLSTTWSEQEMMPTTIIETKMETNVHTSQTKTVLYQGVNLQCTPRVSTTKTQLLLANHHLKSSLECHTALPISTVKDH